MLHDFLGVIADYVKIYPRQRYLVHGDGLYI